MTLRSPFIGKKVAGFRDQRRRQLTLGTKTRESSFPRQAGTSGFALSPGMSATGLHTRQPGSAGAANTRASSSVRRIFADREVKKGGETLAALVLATARTETNPCPTLRMRRARRRPAGRLYGPSGCAWIAVRPPALPGRTGHKRSDPFRPFRAAVAGRQSDRHRWPSTDRNVRPRRGRR